LKAALIDLLRDVLDHELVDAEGVSCGMVDEIAFEVSGNGTPQVAALLVGPGAWAPRLPALFGVAAAKLFGRHVVRVPWSQVQEIGEVIRLKATASSLGLGRLDRKAGRWLTHLPGS
jgi:sporulation protein YlmC with PRC-barrel domain